MTRALTFPKTDLDVWANAETGVTVKMIVRPARPGVRAARRYLVLVPSRDETGWSQAADKATLAEARAAAKDVAVAMRAQITRAHREALAAFAIVMADRAEAAIAAATHEEALSGEEADRLFGYLTTARLFRETDPERSIGWSNEILTELAKVADRETEAAHAEALDYDRARTRLLRSNERDKEQARAEYRAAGDPVEDSDPVTREQALAAWGQVWAGHVPAELPEAFKAGDYATVLRLANEQIARQEEETDAVVAEADRKLNDMVAVVEEHARRTKTLDVGSPLARSVIATDHAEALREHLAREWYAHGGYASAMTGPEIAAGYRDWDNWISQPLHLTEREDHEASYRMADRVLVSDQPEIVNYRQGGMYGMALLAIKDTLLAEPTGARQRLYPGPM